MDNASTRYIITGGSGSGKSSLIKELENRGYACFPEVSRIVISEQQYKGGKLVPWKDMKGFADECLRRMKKQLQNQTKQQPVFYDRGIPDILAYLKSKNLPVPDRLYDYARYYNPKVFICPPWSEIFVNDPQRPESFEESENIYFLLKNVYTKMNFTIIEVPKILIKERADFVVKEFMYGEK
ncbi:MAG: AAA family ATPase [bacterium]